MHVKFVAKCPPSSHLHCTSGGTNAGEPSLPWQIKIMMTCVRIILKDESQTVGNSPHRSSKQTLNPTNQPFLSSGSSLSSSSPGSLSFPSVQEGFPRSFISLQVCYFSSLLFKVTLCLTSSRPVLGTSTVERPSIFSPSVSVPVLSYFLFQSYQKDARFFLLLFG